MCAIAGIHSIDKIESLLPKLKVMNDILVHRGPDGKGFWVNDNKSVGFSHNRLAIIDKESGHQPMKCLSGNVICYNGEIYNYRELKNELKEFYSFKTNSDTEVILASYLKWGENCVDHFKGMFAFVIWDNRDNKLFLARDRFGIKPLYYYTQGNDIYFASECKALLPFVKDINTNNDALYEYIHFQFTFNKTLFDGIKELPPAHTLIKKGDRVITKKYWNSDIEIDYDHTESYFKEKLRYLLKDTVDKHLVSDVGVSSYVSGGVDSAIISGLIDSNSNITAFRGIHGTFEEKGYSELNYAYGVRELNEKMAFDSITINPNDFINNIEKVIYHLDYPVAGIGSFAQYCVAKMVSNNDKVVFSGLGADELFGGYTRYLIAYFEQCLKGAIDGTLYDGNFIVTYESIIPNLTALKNYKPLLRNLFSKNTLGNDDVSSRYFHLVNKSGDYAKYIDWNKYNLKSFEFGEFIDTFHADNKVTSYLDKMTRFDMRTLLPALLQVEDRMSMAHGVEARVPFMDHELVELSLSIPSNIKFANGTLKKFLINSMEDYIPKSILERKDKMGFPVPLNKWVNNNAKLNDYVYDILNASKSKNRSYLNNKKDITEMVYKENADYSRELWVFLSLELWYQQFHDKQSEYQNLINKTNPNQIIV